MNENENLSLGSIYKSVTAELWLREYVKGALSKVKPIYMVPVQAFQKARNGPLNWELPILRGSRWGLSIFKMAPRPQVQHFCQLMDWSHLLVKKNLFTFSLHFWLFMVCGKPHLYLSSSSLNLRGCY